jgi:hypothetical protein
VNPREPGIFFTIEEMLSVFPRLKKNEALLDFSERPVLLKIERFLYQNLSVEELESLSEKSGVPVSAADGIVT